MHECKASIHLHIIVIVCPENNLDESTIFKYTLYLSTHLQLHIELDLLVGYFESTNTKVSKPHCTNCFLHLEFVFHVGSSSVQELRTRLDSSSVQVRFGKARVDSTLSNFDSLTRNAG